MIVKSDHRKVFHLPKSIFVLILAVASGLSVSCSGRHENAGNSTTPGTTVFGDEVSLQAYAVHPRDSHTEIELKWAALRKPSADYDVFVHAIDASGAILFQLDHPLKNGAGQSATNWNSGDAISDEFLATPSNRAPGAYNLRIGLYVASPMKILPITHSGFPQPKDGWNDRAVLIENVDCR